MYNVMEKQTDTEVRRAQVIYLDRIKQLSRTKIAEITGYTVSTVKNYISKFAHLLEYAKTIFEEKIEKIRKTRKSKYDELINANGFDITSKSGEICYLFRFFDDEQNLICSKVGTTTRTIKQRLKEELGSKTYKKMGATNAIVDRVYNCGDLPAEGLESLLRSEYIKKFPKAFKKNDRFIKTVFDLNEADKIANEYLALS